MRWGRLVRRRRARHCWDRQAVWSHRRGYSRGLVAAHRAQHTTVTDAQARRGGAAKGRDPLQRGGGAGKAESSCGQTARLDSDNSLREGGRRSIEREWAAIPNAPCRCVADWPVAAVVTAPLQTPRQ